MKDNTRGPGWSNAGGMGGGRGPSGFGPRGGARGGGRPGGSKAAMRSVPKPTTKAGVKASGVKGPVTPKRVAAMKTQAKKPQSKAAVDSKLTQIEKNWNKLGKGMPPIEPDQNREYIYPRPWVGRKMESNSLAYRQWWRGRAAKPTQGKPPNHWAYKKWDRDNTGTMYHPD